MAIQLAGDKPDDHELGSARAQEAQERLAAKTTGVSMDQATLPAMALKDALLAVTSSRSV